MPARILTLKDLFAPALAADGVSTGSEALDAVGRLPVLEWTLASDASGSVIRGKAGLDDLELIYRPPLTLDVAARVGGDAATRPRDSWVDIRDTRIDFLLHIPHASSALLDAATGDDAALLDALDTDLADPPPSLAPGTGFTLDLLVTAMVIRPPGLVPAEVEDGLLVRHRTLSEVRIGLPKVKLRLAMAGVPDASGGVPVTLDLLSLGAEGLDDPGDLGVAELVTMDPPHALFGDSGVLGFGFRSATLDLSAGSTPPAILKQFGCDDGWRGLYLPEARLYLAPGGRTGLAFTGIVTNVLLSFEGEVVLSADAKLAVIEQGDGALKIGARFVTATRSAPYGITYQNGDNTLATAELPGQATILTDVSGGRPPYKVTISVDGGDAVDELTRIVDVPATGTTVRIVASDGNAPGLTQSAALTKTLDISITRVAASTPAGPPAPLPGQQTPAGPVPAAVLAAAPGTSPGVMLRIVGQTDSQVTVTLDPPSTQPTSWSSGGTATTGATVTLDVAPGASVALTASRPGAGETVNAFWRFDRPPTLGPVTTLRSYQANPQNAQDREAAGSAPDSPFPPGARPFVDVFRARLAALPAGTSVPLLGFASYEGDRFQVGYNQNLSERRAEGLQMQLQAEHPALHFPFTAVGHGPAKVEWDAPPKGEKPPRSRWWKVAVALPAGTPLTASGTLTRGTPTPPGTIPATPVVPAPDAPAPGPPPPPPWFRKAEATVRIIRDQLIALELAAKIDFQTALEQELPPPPAPAPPLVPQAQPVVPPPPNTGDGLTDFRIVVQQDPATGTVTTRAFVGADPSDTDGLFLWGWRPGEQPDAGDFGRNYVGFMTAFLPLLSKVTAPLPTDGALTDLVDTLALVGVPAALAGLTEGGVLALRAERIVLYGIEALVEDRADGAQTTFLFDIETALSLEWPQGDGFVIRIPRTNPLSVRYKAIGMRLGPKAGQSGVRFHPVFDASRGYTIDASRPGQIQLREGLDNILRVLGARVARTNPLSIEVDIGSAVELGPVTISRARVRVPLDPPGPPELTALGVAVDIAGALRGKGELEIGDGGLAGALDVTLVPIGLRIAAELALEKAPPKEPQGLTSLFLSLAVEFPAPIPLWSSGLGIYGFLGAFAMNRRRNQPPGTGAAGALQWLQSPEVDGDPTRRKGWVAEAGAWGFGLGAVLGTLDGGFLFNLRGALILELPGPNLILTMKARLLSPRPGTLPDNVPAIEALAVIDIDLEAGTLSIGLLVSYEIKWLLKLHVPVEAFFDTNDLSNWHVFVGKADPAKDRVQARVLSAFDGSGYLMLSGQSLTVPHFPSVPGFNVAAGLHVSFVWGSVQARLYARVGGGFDALLGFDPLSLQGKIRLDGELRLFVVSIGAHAALDLVVAKQGDDVAARLDGEICGRVEFFFFDVEGCVDFGMGAASLPGWTAPELVAEFAVMSRSPALAAGTGIGRPIDAKVPIDKVPIDSIPVLTLRAPPASPHPLVFGAPILGPAGGLYDGFVALGGRRVRYVVESVVLEGPLDGDIAPADTPSVWWLREPPSATRGTVQLALLTSTPTPAAKAIEYGVHLKEQVTQRCQEACGTEAAPAFVLWTFLRHPIGPSKTGWNLWDGIAWPDAAGAVRSSPPDIVLRVDEAWRASVPPANGVEPAAVEILAIACPPLGAKWRTPWLPAFGDTDRVLQARLELESKLALAAAGEFGAAAAGVKPDGAGAKTFAAARRIAELRPKVRPRRNCYARMLGSPAFDDDGGEAGGMGLAGLPSPTDALAAIFGKKPAKPQKASPWSNVLRVHCGPCGEARLFLRVRPDVFRSEALVVAVLDAEGGLLQMLEPVVVADPADLPPRWRDKKGPWQRPMAFVTGFDPAGGYVPVLVTGKGLEQASRIEIGTRPVEGGGRARRIVPGRPFYLGAVEALRMGEVARAAWDAEQIVQDAAVVAASLGAESHRHAMLVRNTDYKVHVTYTVEEEGKPPPAGQSLPKLVQSFDFRTDDAPPASLRPWLLASHPAEGEAHVFGGEKVAIVFATDDVARLWAGYGHSLRARLRAASYRQPEAGGGAHPWPLEGRLDALPASVVSPWEQAMIEAVAGDLFPCVGELGVRTRHAELTIPVALDPFTDYTLVVEAVDEAAAIPPGKTEKPGSVVLSLGFSTSAHATAADFARAVIGAPLAHAHVPVPDALRAFATAWNGRRSEGTAFDEALAAAGLGAVMRPPSAQASVFWSTPADGPPQPVAVLVDAPEALWRTRPIPRTMDDPDSQTSRVVMTPVAWLHPVELAATMEGDGAPAAGGDRLVEAMTASPGGERLLFVLKPGARGRPLVLGLRHVKLSLGAPGGGEDPCPADPAQPPGPGGPPVEWLRMLGVTLARAPWEDDEE